METLKLDGRNFRGVDEAMTATQDDFIMTQLRRSGAMDLLVGIDGLAVEEKLSRGREMFDRIVESGRKYKLLAGLIIEEGKKWNQADAETNAAGFAAITDTDEKIRMSREVMRYVNFFFQRATPSSEISPNSSNQKEEAPGTESAEAVTSATFPISSVP